MKHILNTSLLIIGLLAVFHSVVCENAVDTIVYSLMCVGCIVDYTQKNLKGIMKGIGVLLCGAAVGLWHLHAQLSCTSLVFGVILLSGGIYTRFAYDSYVRRCTNAFLFICGLYALYESGLIQATYLHARERHIAVLNRGVWGVEHPHQKSLNITGQYSYDLFRESLKAEIVDELSSLDRYTDLFIVTPTAPFSRKDIDMLKRWVYHGGHLIVITDHTDLFGHVRVLEPLLEEFGVQARKDSIIERHPDACRYYSLADRFEGLTSNSYSGKGTAFLWQIGFSERVDYASPSFFSDNQVADDDKAGVYVVGLRRACNLGIITLFGDSTLFSNFALSFPSSQKIIKAILSPLYTWNLHIFVFVFALVNIVYHKIRIRLFIIGMVILMALVRLVGKCSNVSAIQADKAYLLPVAGDASCVEGRDGEFRTLFASAYAYGILPVWENDDSLGNGLQVGRRKRVSLSDFSTPWDASRNSKEVLSSTCTCQLHEYLYALIIAIP